VRCEEARTDGATESKSDSLACFLGSGVTHLPAAAEIESTGRKTALWRFRFEATQLMSAARIVRQVMRLRTAGTAELQHRGQGFRGTGSWPPFDIGGCPYAAQPKYRGVMDFKLTSWLLSFALAVLLFGIVSIALFDRMHASL
jgi:hypothetical protein